MIASPSTTGRIEARRRGRRGSCPARCASPPRGDRRGEEVLGSYLDARGRTRALVRREGAGGSTLVLDEDRLTGGDRRLLAHLAADEPTINAELVCALYLEEGGRARCRRLRAEDMRLVAPTEAEGLAPAIADRRASVSESARASMPARDAAADAGALRDRAGNLYELRTVEARIAIPELRWCNVSGSAAAGREPLSVRDLVGALERYEPVRALSAETIACHRDDPRVSVATLAAELERLNASRIVLNRGLREAVLAAVAGGGLSMSEIALRCGRVKRDRRGVLSGETSWLSRRIGLVCERGASAPTPWVHSDVLALVARSGLGIAPREVELT